MLPWLLIAIGVLIILFLIVAVFIKKGKKKPTDYYSLFMMGAIWVPFGIIMIFMEPDFSMGPFFFVIGWIYFVMGIIHKDEWKKNQKANLIKNDWLRGVVIGLLALLVAIGIVFYLGYK